MPSGMPGHVWFVAQQIAFFKQILVDEVLRVNRKNVTELYGIPPWNPTAHPLKVVEEKATFFACNGAVIDDDVSKCNRGDASKPIEDKDDPFDVSKWIHTCNGRIRVTRT